VKRRTVIYSPEAAEDLDRIYGIVADAGDPLTADRYDQRIRALCERLDHASERGTLREDVRPGLRIVGFERRITVAFAVDEDRVTILRLFYGGANWEGLDW